MAPISSMIFGALFLVLVIPSLGNDCLVDVVLVLDRSSSICCACQSTHCQPTSGIPKDQCQNPDGSFKFLKPCPNWKLMTDAVNTFTQQFKNKAMAGSRLG